MVTFIEWVITAPFKSLSAELKSSQSMPLMFGIPPMVTNKSFEIGYFSFIFSAGFGYLLSMFTITGAQTTEKTTSCRSFFALTERRMSTSSVIAILTPTHASRTTSMP